MNGEKPGSTVPRMMHLPASRQVVMAAAAVLLAAGALGLLIWALASSRQLAWLTSISNVLAVDLAAWTASAGMLAWVIRSRKSAADGVPAQVSRSPGLPAGPVSEIRGGQFGKKNKQVNYFIGDTARRHESGIQLISASDGDSPPRSVRVADAQPRRFGVHRPIEVAGATSDQPAYVPRDTDCAPDGVRAEIATAARDSGLVVVVGDSSSGKTRTLLEAVTAAVPNWRMVAPGTVAEIGDLADGAPTRVVVWLDDLKKYLDAGLSLAVVRRLLGGPGPVVLAGTLWPRHRVEYAVLPESGQPDPHREARGILDQATCVDLGSQLSVGERARAEQMAAADPRIRVALDGGGDFGFTQTMAAARELVTRWRGADPYATAVIEAAIDATRLGTSSPLREDLLSAAAPGYCGGGARASAPGDWFGAALGYTEALVAGAASILRPESSPGAGMGEVSGYVLADYISQVGGQERAGVLPPAEFWEAVLDHAGLADLPVLAGSARDRGLYRHAARLYKRAGSSLTAEDAVDLLEMIRDVDHGGTRDAALWIAGNADLTDASGTGLLLFRLSQWKVGNDVLAAVIARAAGRTSLRETGQVAFLAAKLPRGEASEAVSALADRAAGEVSLAGEQLVYAEELLYSLHKRGLTRAVHHLADRIAREPDPAGAHLASLLIRAMRHVGETSAAAAFAEQAVRAIDITDPDDVAVLLNAMREAGTSTAITALLALKPEENADTAERFHMPYLARALRKAGAVEAAATLISRIVADTDIADPGAAADLLCTLRQAGVGSMLVDVAARAARKARLGDPGAVARLLLALIDTGQGNAATALVARNPHRHVDITDPKAVADLLWALHTAGAADAVAALLSSHPAVHAKDADLHAVAGLSRVLRQVGADDAVEFLTKRAAGPADLTDTRAVAFWLTMMVDELGADPAFDTALLARNPARHVSLADPAAVAELLDALRVKHADGAVAELLRRHPEREADLASPSAVAHLIHALRAAGAHQAVASLASPNLAEEISLDDPDGTISLLRALHDAGSGEAVAAVLSLNPISRLDVRDPETVSRQLSALQGISGGIAVDMLLALDPAAHASLDKPHLVAGLLNTLRQVGAAGQATKLANRAATHGIFHGRPANATREPFGSEPDGRPSDPWTWQDLN